MPATKMEAPEYEGFKEIFKKFKTITSEPEQFLLAQPTKCDGILDVLQEIYSITTDSDAGNSKSALVLPRLVTEEMDDEQVWQQLEMRNDVILPQLLEQTAKLLAIREQKLEIRLKEDDYADEEKEEEEEENITDDGLEENIESDLEDADEDVAELEQHQKQPKKKLRSSIVDDKFFKLGEMEEFLQAEDEKDMRKKKGKLLEEDDDGIDYFAEDFGEGIDDEAEDDVDGNLKYNDFFDEEVDESNKRNSKHKKKKERDYFAEKDERNDNDASEEAPTADSENENEAEDSDDGEDDDDDDDENSENEAPTMEPASDSDSDSESNEKNNEKPKSSFELRQERLEERIREYEQVVLGEKPWQLKGEIQATSRPQNSLLEEILEFDSSVRPAPLITEETTKCLEDIIKQRIKDKAWDDVVRTVRPIKTPQEYRKQLVLDQEKSKESLAQIYEKEYQREIDKLKPNSLNDAPEEEPKEHTEIRQRMRALFLKLDALSNFHFTPKPVAPEPKIITNTPAIAMEEVAPVAVSDANLLAPEEVYRGPKHELVGKSERDRTDKNRERRKKKSKQRAIHKALEQKDLQRQKLGIPLSKKEESAKLLKTITKHRNVEKVTASNDQSALKSSKAFFSKLQDSKATAATKKAPKRKPDANSLSAKKLKL